MTDETIGLCLLQDRNEHGFYALSFSDFDRAPEIPELEDLQGGGYTWSGIVDSLVRMRAPDLAPHLEYDSEGDTFVALSKDAAALRRVAALIADVLDDPDLLRRAIEEADPDLLE